jgi:hypothetical protein
MLLTVLALLGGDARAPFQEPCPAPVLGEPVPFCRLQDRDRGLGDFPPARYPPVLLSAGIAGTVRVELVIDSLGRADPTRVRVLSSTPKQFVEPLREAIRAHRFPVPIYAGSPVEARLQLSAEFRLPELDRVPSRRVTTAEVTEWGYAIRFEQKPIWRAWPAASLSSADSAAVLAEARRYFDRPAPGFGELQVSIYDVWTSDVVIAGVGYPRSGRQCDFVRMPASAGWTVGGRCDVTVRRAVSHGRSIEAEHCTRAGGALVSSSPDTARARAASYLLGCPSTGPGVLVREWASQSTDTAYLAMLSAVSAGIRDHRVFSAVKAVALSSQYPRAARVAAMRALVAYFDATLFVDIRPRPGLPPPHDIAVALGTWSHPPGRDGTVPLLPSAGSEILATFRRLRDEPGDAVVSHVAGRILLGLEVR